MKVKSETYVYMELFVFGHKISPVSYDTHFWYIPIHGIHSKDGKHSVCQNTGRTSTNYVTQPQKLIL
jgi:hypothetical protein